MTGRRISPICSKFEERADSPAMSEAPIVCILCNPRSGSNALRTAFAASPRIMDCGEIFHNRREYTETRFLDFLQQWPRPVHALLDYDESIRLARAFLDAVRSEAHGRSVLIDIKHNSWGVLHPLWKFPHEPPLFLNLLKDQAAKIILIKRGNLAEQVISFHLAMQTELWDQTLTPANLPARVARHEFQPEAARHLCRLFVRAEALLEEFLGPYFHRLTLRYEEMFNGDGLTASAAEKLEEFTDITLEKGPLPLRSNTVDKRELISNYEQICDVAREVQAEFPPC
jgi:LPS sulfotransferase NodH